MKHKRLVAAAVASAFGLSASAFAGSGPVSVNENTPWLPQHFFSFSSGESGTGGYTSEAGGMVIIEQISTVEPAVLTEDAVALADLGIYSDFYRVSFTPIAVDQWNHYVLSPVSGDGYAAAEEFYVFTPGDVVYMLDFSSPELSPDELASLSDNDWMGYIAV